METKYKVIIAIAVFVVALIGILLLTGTGDPELEGRAQEWGELQLDFPSGDKKADISRITSFLEPSAARDTRAAEYYNEHNDPSFATVTGMSVEGVKLSSDGNSAIVTYSMTAVLRGTELSAKQGTPWTKKDGTWYRTLEAAQITL